MRKLSKFQRIQLAGEYRALVAKANQAPETFPRGEFERKDYELRATVVAHALARQGYNVDSNGNLTKLEAA